jgi:malate dehydrogenase (oxaloacetate-decarboxylating)
VLVFPGIFKGALTARAKDITEDMKTAAAYALADFVTEEELKEDYVIPPAFKPGVAKAIATAVAGAWGA